MGNESSKHERKDSKSNAAGDVPAKQTHSAQSMKRKPLPGSSIGKKFAGLADLKNGPRKSAGQKQPSISSKEEVTVTERSVPSVQTTVGKNSVPATLPPTPDELPVEKKAPLPPPPRKVYAGLPSNPRARSQDKTVPIKSIQAKGSNTAFDISKVCISIPKPVHIRYAFRGQLDLLA
jgi:hypothetical protein